MDFISRAKLLMSKRGLGIIGLVLIIFSMIVGMCDFFIIDPGIYLHRCAWLVDSLFILWLSLSVGYKLILILNLKKIKLLLMGWLASIIFVIFFVLNWATTTEEVRIKIVWYYGLVFSLSVLGSIAIDMFASFTDTFEAMDENVQSVKKVANFFISKIRRRKIST